MLSEPEWNENTESVGDDGRGDDPRLNDRLRGGTLEPAFTARFGEDWCAMVSIRGDEASSRTEDAVLQDGSSSDE